MLPWHTDRLRLVELAAALAGACAALGKMARDVTLLAQSEVAEVAEGDAGGQAGGSSAMPHKRNPVAAVLDPRLHPAGARPAGHASPRPPSTNTSAPPGAWHAEWEPLADLLRLTGSAASWAAALLAGLRVDAARMRANLDAARGLPLAEHVTAVLAPRARAGCAAHDLIAEASRVAAGSGRALGDVLLDTPEFAEPIAAAGISPDQVRQALEPADYLGAASAFVTAALDAHAELESRAIRTVSDRAAICEPPSSVRRSSAAVQS